MLVCVFLKYLNLEKIRCCWIYVDIQLYNTLQSLMEEFITIKVGNKKAICIVFLIALLFFYIASVQAHNGIEMYPKFKEITGLIIKQDTVTPVQINPIRIKAPVTEQDTVIPIRINVPTRSLSKRDSLSLIKKKEDTQNRKKVTGNIIDEKGTPLPGVYVKMTPDSVLAVADVDGKFTVFVAENTTLIFSFMGFRDEKVKLKNQTDIKVRMKEDSELLSEVVVVGFGTQAKSSLTAAITTVDTKQLTNIPKPSVVSALQGRVPGLTINETSGAPGASPSILVRGKGTIDPQGGEYSPMIILDGIPFNGNIGNIPANDIQSISVLKDAAAAAIYGARAANGVIMIVTKRGLTEGAKPTVEYNFNLGFQTVGQIPQKLSAKEYANLLNEVAYNDGQGAVFDDKDMAFYNTEKTDDLHGNTDWQKVVLRELSPIITNHLSVSGNGKIGSYYVSAEHLYQRGMLKMNDRFERLNIRANVISEISNRLRINYSAAYINTSSPGNDVKGNMFGNMFRAPAIGNATVSDGHYGDMIYAKGSWLSDISNVWHWMNVSGPNSEKSDDLFLRGNLLFTPIDGLELNANAGYNIIQSNNSYYTPKDGSWNVLEQKYSQERRNSYSENWRKVIKNDYQITGSYEKKFGDNFFKVLVGGSAETYKNHWTSATRYDYINDSLHELKPGDKSTAENDGSTDHWSFASLFGRFNYDFDKKYLLELSLRYDGSSRFAPKERWGLFPAVSAGWNIHNERFMKKLDFVDHLKLRASWGQLGNSEKIGLYLWNRTYSVNPYYSFDDKVVTGVRPARLANNLVWETTTSYNVGLEASLWRGKLSLELDLWKKDTEDIILEIPISGTVGVQAVDKNKGARIAVNAGKVSSHGLDLSISHEGRIGRDISYNGRFTLTAWNSWVVDLGDRATPFSTEFRPGGDIGDMYGYEALGIINDDKTLEAYKAIEGVDVEHIKKGDLYYKDQNGDGKLDHRDVIKIGNENIKSNYGISLGFDYKGINLGLFFQGAFNVDRWISGDSRESFINYRSPDVNQLDRWTEDNPNPNATYPRLRRQYTFNNANSDWWVRSGSYIRLKELQVGYDLPRSFVSKLYLQQLRFYFSATNLFTIAPDYLEGYNPEAGMQSYIYPTMRTYSFGFNLKF